jgi:hypothetical protein
LSLNSATGEISGTPKTAGSLTFTVLARDVNLMTASRQYTVTVAGLACSAFPIRIGRIPDVQYNSLGAAYNDALDGDTIQSQAMGLAEDLFFDNEVSIKLMGGYDCSYSSNPWNMKLRGSLRIRKGTVAISNLVFE